MPARPSTSTATSPSGQRRYTTAQQAGTQVTAIVAAAELAILAAIASYVAAVAAGTLLAAVAGRRLRTVVVAIVTQAESQLRPVISGLSAAARADVQDIIAADLGPFARLLPLVPSASVPRLSASLRNAMNRAAAEAEAAFRRIVAEDPAQAQAMLDELSASGLTGFTGRTGRNWNLSSYAEMATRTAAEQLHLALQLHALQAAGIDMVYVARDSSLPPCGKCAPWVHRILSVSGTSLGMPGLAGTLAQARATGLLHPQCRDSIVPYSGQRHPEGPRAPSWLQAQQARYQAEQEASTALRAYRMAQRQHAVAISPIARARARRLIRHLAP